MFLLNCELIKIILMVCQICDISRVDINWFYIILLYSVHDILVLK